jgi:uncharacterized protein HemY
LQIYLGRVIQGNICIGITIYTYLLATNTNKTFQVLLLATALLISWFVLLLYILGKKSSNFFIERKVFSYTIGMKKCCISAPAGEKAYLHYWSQPLEISAI